MSQPRTFYCVTPGLVLYAGNTRTVIQDGHLTSIDPPCVRFTPLGSLSLNGQKFGYFKTADPEIIAYLDERAAQNLDVITDEEFNRRVTPPDVVAKEAKAEADTLRAENNRLLAMLEEMRKNKGSQQK